MLAKSPTARDIINSILDTYTDSESVWRDSRIGFMMAGDGSLRILAFDAAGEDIAEIRLKRFAKTLPLKGKRLKIGVLEDEKFFYLAWEKAFENLNVDIDCQWIQSFDECYEALPSLDILIADRVIIKGGIEDDLLFDGHIEKIAATFKGPIILCSDAGTPPEYKKYLTRILRDKRPPKDLKALIALAQPPCDSEP